MSTAVAQMPFDLFLPSTPADTATAVPGFPEITALMCRHCFAERGRANAYAFRNVHSDHGTECTQMLVSRRKTLERITYIATLPETPCCWDSRSLHRKRVAHPTAIHRIEHFHVHYNWALKSSWRYHAAEFRALVIDHALTLGLDPDTIFQGI